MWWPMAILWSAAIVLALAAIVAAYLIAGTRIGAQTYMAFMERQRRARSRR